MAYYFHPSIFKQHPGFSLHPLHTNQNKRPAPSACHPAPAGQAAHPHAQPHYTTRLSALSLQVHRQGGREEELQLGHDCSIPAPAPAAAAAVAAAGGRGALH